MKRDLWILSIPEEVQGQQGPMPALGAGCRTRLGPQQRCFAPGWSELPRVPAGAQASAPAAHSSA